MPKISWDDFVTKYNNPVAFTTAVPAKLPPQLTFDKNKKKLPTFYSLFSKWCSAYLSGDWAITKVKGGLILSISTNEDTATIQQQFSLRGPVAKTQVSNKTVSIEYKWQQYTELAGDLGYVL